MEAELEAGGERRAIGRAEQIALRLSEWRGFEIAVDG